MNSFAFATGVITAVLIIGYFKKTKLQHSRLAYPLLLASFPVYYFVFAVYAGDTTAFINETGTGIIFIAISLLAIYSKRKNAALMVGAGCILHAAYDAYHDVFFINQGTPAWWPEFCGSIDLILGVYLIYLALNTMSTGRALQNNAVD